MVSSLLLVSICPVFKSLISGSILSNLLLTSLISTCISVILSCISLIVPFILLILPCISLIV
ncbi:hypothetical protein EGM15_12995, partial [Clostridioides difficile]